MIDLNIRTTYYPKPIPTRTFDWCAVRDGYEGPDGDGVGGDPVGYGMTELAAIQDLLDEEEFRRDPDEAAPNELVRPNGQFGVGA